MTVLIACLIGFAFGADLIAFSYIMDRFCVAYGFAGWKRSRMRRIAFFPLGALYLFIQYKREQYRITREATP